MGNDEVQRAIDQANIQIRRRYGDVGVSIFEHVLWTAGQIGNFSAEGQSRHGMDFRKLPKDMQDQFKRGIERITTEADLRAREILRQAHNTFANTRGNDYRVLYRYTGNPNSPKETRELILGKPSGAIETIDLSSWFSSSVELY